MTGLCNEDYPETAPFGFRLGSVFVRSCRLEYKGAVHISCMLNESCCHGS